MGVRVVWVPCLVDASSRGGGSAGYAVSAARKAAIARLSAAMPAASAAWPIGVALSPRACAVAA